MKKLHLVHVIPSKDLHIFHGYDEIIETLRWGLDQLGFEVTYAVNRFEPSRTNIFFGAQMLALDALRRLPANTIIYNLEQIPGLMPGELRESYRYCGEHFQMWDYSEFNIPTWERFHSAKAPAHVPISYAPTLSRIPKPPVQEIDVLFYGGPGGQRLRIFGDLCARLVRTVFVHGLYGRSRDELIAKAKIVINVNQYPQYGLFEVARVSYLLANAKAVVSDFAETSKIESDLREAVRLCDIDHIVDECSRLLDDDAARTELEQRGFAVMSARDIRKTLARVAIDA